MTADSETSRLNMKKLESDLKYDSRKFLLQTLGVGATLILVTATVTTLVVTYVDHQAERAAVQHERP